MYKRNVFSEDFVESSAELASGILRDADSVFLKKLSLNDWQWTSDPNKHQDGVYIFKDDRDSGFFPPLYPVPRNAGKAILDTIFKIRWPAVGHNVVTESRLVNWRSKGEETHLTRVQEEEFIGLNPASLLLIAKRGAGADAAYSAMTIDSATEGYAYLEDLFSLSPHFRSGIFKPAQIIQTQHDELFKFIESAIVAYQSGEIDKFAALHRDIPKPRELAQLARAQYQELHRNADFNPFSMKAPGDAILDLSRELEYVIFKSFEVRRRSLELVQLILGDSPAEMSLTQALINIVTEFPRIDAVLLSASQTRKSRAGASFELHIEQMLKDGAMPHEVQVVIDAKKRPDFVLPSLAAYADPLRGRAGALVLSAKTTLRERWKQVFGEIRNCDLYLATLDENIAGNAIEDMARQGIFLVVPESLKQSETTVYKLYDNVISFKSFFESDQLMNWRYQ